VVRGSVPNMKPYLLCASFIKIYIMKKSILLFCLSMISILAFPQWIQQTSNTTRMLRSFCFTNENTGIIVGDHGTILKTIDGGLTWYTIVGLITAPIYSAYFTDTTFGYLVGGGNGDEKGFIIKLGEDIYTILPESRTVLYSVFSPDDNTGYAAGIYGTIVKTNDAGHTWNILQHDNGPFYYSVFFYR
jgi:hypothetical protein